MRAYLEAGGTGLAHNPGRVGHVELYIQWLADPNSAHCEHLYSKESGGIEERQEEGVGGSAPYFFSFFFLCIGLIP